MMTKQKQLDQAIALIKRYPTPIHSPFYSVRCSESCPVCNMDEELYRIARKQISDKQ